MPIPDLSNKPGPGRPGYPTGAYDFQFEVTGAVSIKANAAASGNFRISWPNGTTNTYSGDNASIAAPDATAGIVSINNEELDTTYADEFAIVSGQTNVSKVISWGKNPWSNMTNAFSGCTSLSDISTTSFISSTQGDMVTMFNGCTSLIEADIRNWDLTAGADWAEGGPFKGLVNLQKLNATGLNVKLINQANKAFNGIGTAVTDGCEFLMSGFNISTSTIANSSLFFGGCRIAPTSNFSNWVFNPSGFDGTSMFNSAVLTGANSTLNCSGWSTYSGSQLPRFNSFNYNFANSNATQLFPGTKIDFTDLNVSSVNYMVSIYYYTGISEIIGLNTWGATAGNVNMSGMFEGSSYLKFSDSDNFNSTFVNSLTPSNFDKVFFRNGDALTSNYGVAPNIANIDVSNCVSLSQTFKGLRCTNVPAINTATFPSTAISLHQLFHNARFISSSETHVDFSNTTIKINSKRQMFSSTWVDKVTFGDNVDFSALTDVYNMCYYMNGSNPDGTTTELTYPTNANFSSLTTTAGWFDGLQGPTTGPLTTCQIDNLIRSFRVTAYNNALNVNFYQSQITEAPSVVRTLEAELVANGWTITENATDATIPFQYGTVLEPDTNITPTNNTGSAFTGTFTSTNSNIAVNSTTGVINTSNVGNTTIRYTLDDGCYTEQAISLAPTGIANNYSMSFDSASSDYINTGAYLGDLISLSAPTSYTVSAWIKTTDNGGLTRGVVSSANYSNGLNFNVFQGEVSFGVSTGAALATTTTANINDGNWHHVVGTYDSQGDASGNTLYLYVDGIQKASNTGNRGIYAFTNYPLFIGAKGAGSSPYSTWNGQIDEVAIWNTALTSTQIQSIYDAKGTNLTKDLTTVSGSNLKYWNRMGD